MTVVVGTVVVVELDIVVEVVAVVEIVGFVVVLSDVRDVEKEIEVIVIVVVYP